MRYLFIIYLLALSSTMTLLSGCDSKPKAKTSDSSVGNEELDSDGFDKNGFHGLTRLHRETKSLFDPKGHDYQGFDRAGFHEKTHLRRDGKKVDPSGYDFAGYDAAGFNRKPPHLHRSGKEFDAAGYNFEGYNAAGFHRDPPHLHRSGKKLDAAGYDFEGYGADGFHRVSHLQRDGSQFDGSGHDYEGYDAAGFHRATHLQRGGSQFDVSGHDYEGYDAAGFHRATHLQRGGSQFDVSGHDYEGYDAAGFHRVTHLQRGGSQFDGSGHDYEGYNADGFHRATHLQRDGSQFDGSGHDYEGYDAAGFHRATHLQRDGSRFDGSGHDYEGYNAAGFHRATHLQRDGSQFDGSGHDYEGFNAAGFHRNPPHHHRDGGEFDPAGYNHQGFNATGYDRRGFNAAGNHRDTGDAYGLDDIDRNGFDRAGLDQLGLDTPDAKTFRETMVLNYFALLSAMDFQIVELMFFQPIANLNEAKLAYQDLIDARQFLGPIPSDKDIHNDLKRLNDTLTAWVTAGHAFNVVDPSIVGEINARLEHVEAMVRTPGRLLYVDLWQQIEDAIVGAKDAFYESIYHALSAPAIINEATFPALDDAAYNHDPVAKRDYLILALVRIKNAVDLNPVTLAPGITSTIPAPKPNVGAASWLARQRIRLYRFSEVVNTLSDADKATALAFFLHAGKNCADAKEDMYDTLLRSFNFAAHEELEHLESAFAVTLQEKMKAKATEVKANIFGRMIDALYATVSESEKDGRAAREDLIYLPIANPLADPGYRTPVEQVRAEGISYRVATWDHTAPSLGLPLKETLYPAMRLNFNRAEFFAPANYTPQTLAEAVWSSEALGKEIVAEYTGVLLPLIDSTSTNGKKLVIGAMIERGFFRLR